MGTMRGSALPWSGQHTQRSTVTLNSKALHGALKMKKRTAHSEDAHAPKKSIIGSLEDMLSADVHRSNADDESEMDEAYEAKMKHVKARSLTDLEVDVAGDDEDAHDAEENEIFAKHQKGLAK